MVAATVTTEAGAHHTVATTTGINTAAVRTLLKVMDRAEKTTGSFRTA
jgi:hypothetical protein